MKKEIDKSATKQAIFDKCDSTIGLSIKKELFDSKIITDTDYLEACEFVKIKPIYKQ